MKKDLKTNLCLLWATLLLLFFAQVSMAQPDDIRYINRKLDEWAVAGGGNAGSQDIQKVKSIIASLYQRQATLESSLSSLRSSNAEQSALLASVSVEKSQIEAELSRMKSLASLQSEGAYVDLLANGKAYNLSPSGLKDSIATIKEWRSCTINEPRKLATLNSGSDYFYHTITIKNSGNAQLLGLGSVQLSKNQSILVTDYIHYKDTICTPGNGPKEMKTVRMAAGVRLSLTITAKDKKFEATLPKKIAAAMELNMVEVTYRISTLGFANDETKNIISKAGDGNFDLDAYVKVMGTMGELIKAMGGAIMVNPIRLPSPAND